MFKLIASDLYEFASLVKDDTAAAVSVVRKDAVSALDTLDTTLGRSVQTEAQREAQLRMTIREVYSTALPQAETKATATASSPSHSVESFKEFENIEMVSFQRVFDINEKTEEISMLLQQHDRLEAIFEELVPIEVSYEEFWRRHFYRCDANRIQRAWDVQKRLCKDPSAMNFSSVIPGVVSTPLRLVSKPLSAIRKVVAIDSVAGQGAFEARCGTAESNKMLDAQKEVEIMQSALAISNNRISSLRFSVDELKNELKERKRTNAELLVEVALLKKQLKQKVDIIKNVEDNFLVKIGGQSSQWLPKHLDASGRTDATEFSSESTTDLDNHIGTCVTLQTTPTCKSPERNQLALWDLSLFGNWGGSESESSIPNGWDSEDDGSSSGNLILE